MTSPARYYDGETARVLEVGVRPTAGELIIFRPADSTIVARWPVNELAVLGDGAHEAAPPIVRRGAEARLVIEDPEQRRQLAALLPDLAALADRVRELEATVARLTATLNHHRAAAMQIQVGAVGSKGGGWGRRVGWGRRACAAICRPP